MKRALILLALAGCDPGAAASGLPTREFIDSRGKAVKVPHPPRRIASVVPSATELLFAIGAGDRLVGVTTSCDWPPEARSKPKVGSIVIDYERLASMEPDLVITSAPQAMKATADLEAKGYPVFSVAPTSLDEIAAALRTLGRVTGHEEGGNRAAAALEARMAAIRTPPDGPTFYFEHTPAPLGSTGPDSYAGDALRRAGGKNILSGGWRNIDWEIVMKADPEMILIAHDRREGLERRAGWADLKAVKGGRVHFMTQDHFVRPTPRLMDGLEEAAKVFRAKNP